MNTTNQIRNNLKKFFQVANVQPTTHLYKDLGLNDDTVQDFRDQLEDEFSVIIYDDEFNRVKNVGDLQDLLLELIAENE